MPAPGQQRPPRWNSQTLEQARTEAVQVFIQERASEGGQRYRGELALNTAAVIRLFDATDDLRGFESGAVLAAHTELLDQARYLGGPPVSADDLDILAGMKVSHRRRLSADLAQQTASVIEAWLDRDRFPWLFEPVPRKPTPVEREIAVRWTAGLIAAQRTQTARRTEAAGRQQAKVRQILRDVGFREVAPRKIEVTGDLGRGEFCSAEVTVAGTKCDVPIGLHNGRLLLIECKVSNSYLNSVKRLNREVGGKAAHWKAVFGQQAYTAAVLAGVFKLKNLEDAQDAGVIIFWQHDLAPLASFIRAAS